MEIKITEKFTFQRIAKGQVFRVDFEGSKPIYAMKIEDITDEDTNELLNAVDLTDGELFRVYDVDEIFPYPNAQLVI